MSQYNATYGLAHKLWQIEKIQFLECFLKTMFAFDNDFDATSVFAAHSWKSNANASQSLFQPSMQCICGFELVQRFVALNLTGILNLPFCTEAHILCAFNHELSTAFQYLATAFPLFLFFLHLNTKRRKSHLRTNIYHHINVHCILFGCFCFFHSCL